MKSQNIHELPVFVDGKGGNWVKSSLEVDTDANSFRGGRLKLKCVGSVFSLYRRASDVTIDEEKPRSASVKAGSKDSSGNQVGLLNPGQWEQYTNIRMGNTTGRKLDRAGTRLRLAGPIHPTSSANWKS